LDEQFFEEFYNPEQEGEDHTSDSDGHPEVSASAGVITVIASMYLFERHEN